MLVSNHNYSICLSQSANQINEPQRIQELALDNLFSSVAEEDGRIGPDFRAGDRCSTAL